MTESRSGTRIFDYQQAFSRNIGWVTETEQQRLRGKRVAIAGLGGVGGIHLLTLARLGIGKFTISDFDTFDIANFNRQAGATVASLGRPKSEVLAEMALDINPEIDLRVFPAGVQADTVDDFLADVDVYVDGLDFFAFSARRQTFTACEQRAIPVVTAAPLGMGTALLVFGPGGMSFEDYFGFAGCDEMEMAIRFLVGLSPAMLQRGYVADMSRIKPSRTPRPVEHRRLPVVRWGRRRRNLEAVARTRRRQVGAVGPANSTRIDYAIRTPGVPGGTATRCSN